MQTKLTLRLDDRLIRRAKAYAQRSGKSLSELVADLFARLQATTPDDTQPHSAAVRSLAGALQGTKLDRDAYRAHLNQKYK
ncbi:MAG TPA: DUF6364 family protein [Gemmatimonadaceae bacterium]|nr:DUF6364 family protein [Gemmatimonadaceae bacterium]